MTKERKDTIAVTSACIMLAFGIMLTAAGFIIDPMGEVHSSILWILGQALLYAGAVFGIAAYTHGIIKEQVNDLEQRMKNKEQNDEIEA